MAPAALGARASGPSRSCDAGTGQRPALLRYELFPCDGLDKSDAVEGQAHGRKEIVAPHSLCAVVRDAARGVAQVLRHVVAAVGPGLLTQDLAQAAARVDDDGRTPGGLPGGDVRQRVADVVA